MIWVRGQQKFLMLATLKVIFKIPSEKHVEKYLKKWTYLFITTKSLKNPYEKESMSFDIMKLNKEIQSEWFLGQIYYEPEVPLQYQDRYKSILLKHKMTDPTVIIN